MENSNPTPEIAPNDNERRSMLARCLALWREGAWVLARIVFFMLFWFLAMLPWRFVEWLINPTDAALIDDGTIHVRGAVAFALLLIYLPCALALAARATGQFQETRYREP